MKYKEVYKIRVDVHSDCVTTEVLVNTPIDKNDELYEIAEDFVTPEGERIRVNPLWGCIVGFFDIPIGWAHIEPPGIFERLIGITMQRKIDKAKARAQKWIDKQYARQRRLHKAMGGRLE